LCFLEKPYEAIDYLEIARSYQPKLFEVQYYLGYAYYLLGKSDKRQYKNAISHFNKAIKIKEYSPEIYFYRGISQFFGGDVLKANKDFENYDKYAIDSVRTTEFYLYRGITLYHLKKIDEAEKWLANIPQSDSHYSEVLYLRGISLLRDNKPEAAFNDLNKYLKLKPNNPNLHADIAEYYFNNEDLDLAYIYYNKAAKLAHPASQQIMRNYHDSKKSKRKLKKFNITFEISRNWLVDEFSEKESISNCKGAVIYDIADRLFISILENPALSSDPKATCSMWGHEFNTNGVEDEYKTSQYIWQRKISNETWTPESGEAYPIKVWRLLPNLINNQFAVFIWGNPADMELFDFYIHDLLESLKIRR
ncbi:MAG: tetratricopeptide repeat protein, partial [Salinivirgaceae bacterium]|nr:tetratricopeptide repeat protein [Salinivirgaceae bacterium]